MVRTGSFQQESAVVVIALHKHLAFTDGGDPIFPLEDLFSGGLCAPQAFTAQSHCPWPDSNRQPPLPWEPASSTGRIPRALTFELQGHIPLFGVRCRFNGFSCVPWLLPLSGEGNGNGPAILVRMTWA